MNRTELYQTVEKWCFDNPGTGSALGLMRLVLSLYNGTAYSFSVPICVRALDDTRLGYAKNLILDYFDRGESPELLALARKFEPLVPVSSETLES